MGKKRIEKKRKRKESDSESDGENQQKHDKKLKTKPTTSKNIQQIVKRDPVQWKMKFQRNFWNGNPPELVVSNELKLQRKSLGILVKGALHLCPQPVLSFNDSSLTPAIKKILQKLNITIPTSIQMQSIPAILNGCNVLGISPTGSGKTLAYLLPMISHLQHHMLNGISLRVASPIALIIVPTRELALQVVASCKIFKTLYQMKSLAVYGGMDKNLQVEKLRDFPTTEIIVATPGRLLDLMSSNDIVLDRVTYLVIDEADRMLALGFEEQLNTINEFIRPDRQTVLFTATFPGKLRESSIKWMGEMTTTSDGTAIGRTESEFQQTVVIRVNTMELNGSQQNVTTTTTRNESLVENVQESHSSLLDENKEFEEGDGEEAEGEEDDNEKEDESLQTPRISSSSPNNDNSNDNNNNNNNKSSHHTGPTLSLTLNPSIIQHVHVCASHKKPRLLLTYLTRIRQAEKEKRLRQPEPMMIFCSKIKTINFLLKLLKKHNHTGVNILHGQLLQQNRESILNDFKAGKFHTLITTDLSARGIHIKRMRYVINYDFPPTLEQYCHRVGRTGRKEEEIGYSYSLLTRNMAPLVEDLITLLRNCNQQIEPNLELLFHDYKNGLIDFREEEEEEEVTDINNV